MLWDMMTLFEIIIKMNLENDIRLNHMKCLFLQVEDSCMYWQFSRAKPIIHFQVMTILFSGIMESVRFVFSSRFNFFQLLLLISFVYPVATFCSRAKEKSSLQECVTTIFRNR